MWRILLFLALLPGIWLMVQVYKLDAVEKEPVALIVKLLLLGALSAIPTVIAEYILIDGLSIVLDEGTYAYIFIENFFCVALVEEGFKRLFLKWGSWKNKEFDYRFDGIVYAVAVSMGFAILENMLYVFDYGLGTAFLRAVTAVPAHAIFAVFMGHFYGGAKLYENVGDKRMSKRMMRMSLIAPVILHGLYDYLASLESGLAMLLFLALIVVLDIITWKRIKKYATEDEAIS